MGKIGTKTRSVIWPSCQDAKAWANTGYPPYLERKDIPKGYGFWGEIVTVLKRSRGGWIEHYRATAYFLPLAELERMERKRPGPSRPAAQDLAEGPLKWIDFEPRRVKEIPGKGLYTSSLNRHPGEVWFFDFIPTGRRTADGQLTKDVPDYRRLKPRDVEARRKAFRQAAQRARQEQLAKATVVRQIRAEESRAAQATRAQTSAAATQQLEGQEDEDTEGLPMTQAQAEKRFTRAENLVDGAVTEDDIKKALGMVAMNQLYGRPPSADPDIADRRNERFRKKLAAQTLRFIDEAIEVLHARKKELPLSPVEDWQADLDRLVGLYEEYNRLTDLQYKAAEENIRRWRNWVHVLEKMGTPTARMKQSSRAGRRPSYRPDPGIGSEERSLAPGARSTPKTTVASE